MSDKTYFRIYLAGTLVYPLALTIAVGAYYPRDWLLLLVITYATAAAPATGMMNALSSWRWAMRSILLIVPMVIGICVIVTSVAAFNGLELISLFVDAKRGIAVAAMLYVAQVAFFSWWVDRCRGDV